jgi:predicted MFS family arabinose efflux permease
VAEPITDSATEPARPRLRWKAPRYTVAPLRSAGFRAVFLAEVVSEFGNAFTTVALPWLVYQLGGDARQLGLVVAVYGLGRLITTPLGGICTDRFGARPVMVLSDVARTVFTVGLVFVAATGDGGFVAVGALSAAIGLFAGLFQPAAWAITPSLLPAEQLQPGMALSNMVVFAAGLAGPGLAGLTVLALNPATALAVDAATFAVSAAFLARLGVHQRRAAAAGITAPATGSGRRRTGSLFALLRQSKLLRVVLVITGVANLTTGGMIRVGLPALATTVFGAGAAGLGGLLSAFTAGCLLGGVVAAGLSGLRRRGRVAMLSGLVMGVAVLAVPFVGLGGAIVMLLVAGAASTVTNVLVVTAIQRATPPELLGRVMSAVLFCALGLFPVSVALTGFVVDRFGTTSVLVTTGILLLAAFCFGLSRRVLTEARPDPS